MKMELELDKTTLESIVGRKFARLNNKLVEVGYMNDPQLQFIANIQEYGAVIAVTTKMRNFLGMRYNIWLSKGKTHITIPPRHFMYTAFAVNQSKYEERLMKFFALTKNINSSITMFAESIVVDVQDSIKQKFTPWKDNSDMTILLKGFNFPLVNKGNLITDVSYKIQL